MTTLRRLMVAELLATLYLAVALLREPVESLSVLPALWFAVGFLIVESFEIELPRGDATTVSGALIAVTAVHLSAQEAVLAVVAPAALVHLVFRRREGWEDRAQAWLGRTLVTVLAVWLPQYLGLQLQGSGIAETTLYVGGIVASDHVLAQVRSAVRAGTSLRSLVLGNIRFQGTFVGAQIMAAVFASLILPAMGAWGVVVLVVLLMVMRQAFSMYVSVRMAYQSTIEALVRTVEAQDEDKRGHAERVSELATEVGRQLGFAGSTLERLAYAALLHDLGEVGLEAGDSQHTDGLSAAEMIREVTFLDDVAPVLVLAETGDGLAAADEQSRVLGYVVLAASRLDDLSRDRATATDDHRLDDVGATLSERRLGDVEMAFRRAMRMGEGRLFAVSGSGGAE
jgi:hypothetical protein